jgi:hypothetical protein
MDADRLSDTLADALTELRATRDVARQLAGLLVAAAELAELEGHAWGHAPLPRPVELSQLVALIGPALQSRYSAVAAQVAASSPDGAGPAADVPSVVP